ILDEANGGTLILDDIDYLPKEVQSKLLRALDDGTYYRMGEPTKLRQANFRLIATTTKSLPAMIERDLFLPKLYSRLCRWRIYLPPIRENRKGIKKLSTHFLAEISLRDSPESPAKTFDEDALSLLAECLWKGNLRELCDAIENIALHNSSNDGPINAEETASVLVNHVFNHHEGSPFGHGIDRDALIMRILNVVSNVILTAKLTGCSRTTVYNVAKGNRESD
ncbi:sigma 54-interacting transcriptional regulator, partial [Endothiovibrio diazotrophicus]